jgi:hypothetical protein
MEVVLEPGELGFVGDQANARRCEVASGLIRCAPFDPVQVVQPLHFAVNCQCEPFVFWPFVSKVYVAPV